ncbi:MAG: recombinase family protein [Rhodomicrobium sp.]
MDNGFSGPRFDRPALDQMRKDLKTNLFDAIYFLDADRIAREVTIQTIIIEEILKHRKQLVINGKDYVKNPENKFYAYCPWGGGGARARENHRASNVRETT